MERLQGTWITSLLLMLVVIMVMMTRDCQCVGQLQVNREIIVLSPKAVFIPLKSIQSRCSLHSISPNIIPTITVHSNGQNWVLLTNLSSGTQYEATCNTDRQNVTRSFTTSMSVLPQVENVRGSVFYPLLNSTENISVQIFWRAPVPRPTAYNISLMCVNSATGMLEYISGYPLMVNSTSNFHTVTSLVDGVMKFPLIVRTTCIAQVKGYGSRTWSEPFVFSTTASSPHTRAMVLTEQRTMFSPPAAVTVVKVLEQGRTSVPNDGEEFSAIAYDSKMMNYFVLIGNEIRKYNQFLNSPIDSYVLPKNFTPSAIAYDWLSEIIYAAGQMQSDNGDAYIFTVMRTPTTSSAGSETIFQTIYSFEAMSEFENINLTVNPLTGHLHWSSLTNAEQSTQLYQFQINPLQPSVAAATDIEIGTFSLESFTVDVVNNCLVLTDGKGVLQYVSNGSIGNKCPGRATDGTFVTTSNKLEIRAIALDELGIYFAGENQIDVDDMAQPDMTPSGTVQYIRSGGGMPLGGNFFQEVMSIVSTSPGNQPYPSDIGCLSVSSGYGFTANEPLKMISKTNHSIEISWSVSAITGTNCDSVSKPPLMYQVTAHAMPQNMDNNGEYDEIYITGFLDNLTTTLNITGLLADTEYTITVNISTKYTPIGNGLETTTSFRTSCTDATNVCSSSVPSSFQTPSASPPSPASQTRSQTQTQQTVNPAPPSAATIIAISVSGTVGFFIIFIMVAVIIIVIIACILYKKMKKTSDAVCNLYDQRRNPAESAEYDTPTYHMRPAYYCSVGGVAAAYEMPLQRASLSNQSQLGSASTFRPLAPALYEQPVGNGTMKPPAVPTAGDYEVAVRTQLELDNELYTTVDEASELMIGSLKNRQVIPPPVPERQNSDLTNQEYSKLVRPSQRSSLSEPKKMSQEESNYFTLERIVDEDDPTESTFRTDQGSGTDDARGKGQGERKDSKIEEKKSEQPIKEDQSKEQMYSKLDRSESQSTGPKVSIPTIGAFDSPIYFCLDQLEQAPDTDNTPQ